MPGPIDEQVIIFFEDLFESIFIATFDLNSADRFKIRKVQRQVGDCADAACQSLNRFFQQREFTEGQVADILESLNDLGRLTKLEEIANPNVAPETIADDITLSLTCLSEVEECGNDPLFRLAIHLVVQVLTQVGPVMMEWRKLNLSSDFRPLQRVVNRLNKIAEQMDSMAQGGVASVDERFELSYRDYLLQRFHRVEAGTVKMTTNLGVDLRELFVMPCVGLSHTLKGQEPAGEIEADALMKLSAARENLGSPDDNSDESDPGDEENNRKTALEQVIGNPRNVVIGAPGSGKSTFFEWLQLQLASGDQELVMAGEQAIPLLIKVRGLDSGRLPTGDLLVETALASKDKAALMPAGWIERMMHCGRVLFMLDGLDETEPEKRDQYILPWLLELNSRYPECRFLISSRPVGYPLGQLRPLEFKECELLDFNLEQSRLYTQHWCTAVLLAQNVPEEEAREQGREDGEKIIKEFRDYPHIKNLARNPLMLSAICLVNYFERGKLPHDRAILYKLCVEGLLHHWDKRRGIHSEFGLNEKLKVCREVALSMQECDVAECEAEQVKEIFTEILGDNDRAKLLLEHIRYRTGLLIERRPNVFAFAHLTFQEYLAALAVLEGNHIGLDENKLVEEHYDGRWREVIPLYCGSAPVNLKRNLIEMLMDVDANIRSGSVLADSFMASGAEITQDSELRDRVLRYVALSGDGPFISPLTKFPLEEASVCANECLGASENISYVTNVFSFFNRHNGMIDFEAIKIGEKIGNWKKSDKIHIYDLLLVVFGYGGKSEIESIFEHKVIPRIPGEYYFKKNEINDNLEAAIFGMCLLNRFKFADGKSDYMWSVLDRLLGLVLAGYMDNNEGSMHLISGCFVQLSEEVVLPKGNRLRNKLHAKLVELAEIVESLGKNFISFMADGPTTREQILQLSESVYHGKKIVDSNKLDSDL